MGFGSGEKVSELVFGLSSLVVRRSRTKRDAIRCLLIWTKNPIQARIPCLHRHVRVATHTQDRRRTVLTPFFSIVYLWLSVCFSSCEGMGANHGNDAARSRNHRRSNFFAGRISADRRTHLWTNRPRGVCPPPGNS